jgi:hypothetical protein
MSKGFIVALVVFGLNLLIVIGATIHRGLKQHKVDLPVSVKRKMLSSFALSENSWSNELEGGSFDRHTEANTSTEYK